MEPFKRANIGYQDFWDNSLGWFLGFQFILQEEALLIIITINLKFLSPSDKNLIFVPPLGQTSVNLRSAAPSTLQVKTFCHLFTPGLTQKATLEMHFQLFSRPVIN